MKMLVNGKEMYFENAIAISELLEHLDLHPDKVVVEVNMEIIPQEHYNQILQEQDKVEIVSFVGGG